MFPDRVLRLADDILAACGQLGAVERTAEATVSQQPVR